MSFLPLVLENSLHPYWLAAKNLKSNALRTILGFKFINTLIFLHLEGT
jgi:hypothetical protein